MKWRLLVELMVLGRGSQVLGWDGGRSEAVPSLAPCGQSLYPSHSPVSISPFFPGTYPSCHSTTFLPFIWYVLFSSVSHPFQHLLKVGVLSIMKFPLRAPGLHLCAAKKYLNPPPEWMNHFHTCNVLLKVWASAFLFSSSMALYGNFHLCLIPYPYVEKSNAYLV